jgi:hypothetical protein
MNACILLASLRVHTVFGPYLFPTIFAFVFISKVYVFIFVPLLSKISTPGIGTPPVSSARGAQCGRLDRRS